MSIWDEQKTTSTGTRVSIWDDPTVQKAPSPVFEPIDPTRRTGTVAQSTPAVSTRKPGDQSFLGIAGEGLMEAGRGFFRELAAIGAGVANIPKLPGQVFRYATKGELPETPAFKPDPDDDFLGFFERSLFGTDKPITFSSVGGEFPGISESGTAAPFIGGAMGLLDLTTGGSTRGFLAAAKRLKGMKSVTEVEPVLKELGFADDVIRASSKTFTELTDVSEIERSLYRMQEIQKGMRGIDAVEQTTEELGDTIQRGFVTSAEEQFPELLTRVAGQYVPRSTDILSTQARNLVLDDVVTAERIALTGTSDKAIATAAELIKKFTDDASRISQNDILKNALLDKAAEIANKVAVTLTEQGRAVQAASILGRLTPEGAVRFAAREIQRYNESIGKSFFSNRMQEVANLSGEQVATITAKAKQISSLPDGTEKAFATFQLMEYVSQLIPSPLWKKLIAVWKAGLLTGVKTSGLNTLSNLFHGVSEAFKDIPATAVDSIAALFTGRRTMALTGKGAGSGVLEGLQKGWRYFRTGFSERDIGAKLDIRKINFGNSPFARAIQAYEETVFRIIGAEDQPFYYGAKARSLASQAIAIAKNEKLTGDALKARVDELITAPSDEMLKYATLDAETAVFQNTTVLGKIARAIQNIPGGEIVVPFGRTPSAVAMQLFNYSPVGVIAEIGKQIAAGRFDQRLFSQAAGRSITGTGVAYLGSKLYENDMLSLGYPSTESERNLWEAEGRTPNSIKVDGKWRNANVFGPLGLTLVVGGYYQRAMEETGSHWEALTQAAAGAGKSLTEQTFLKGINQFTDAIADPQRSASSFFSGLLGSLIPTIVSDVTRASDVYERRTTDDELTGRAQARAPGLRGGLEPKVSALGEPIARIGNFWEVIADPTRPSAASKDPLVLEIRRLHDIGQKVSLTKAGDKKGFPSLTPAQNTELWKRSGQLFSTKARKLIETDEWKSLEDIERVKYLEDFSNIAKTLARAEMAVELTKGLSGRTLLDKVTELKESGLLSYDVYREYLKIR